MQGGKIEQKCQTIKISCLPLNIPVDISFDNTNFPLGITRLSNLIFPKEIILLENLPEMSQRISF